MPTEPERLEFHILLNDKLRDRNMSLRRLSESTGILIDHLERLSQGDYEHLPSAPYLRGYLKKLGGLLGFDHEYWWEQFRALELRRSGKTDSLPENRFALRTMSRNAWLLGFGLLVLVYLGFRFADIIGRPSIAIDYPSEERTESLVDKIRVTGTAKRASEVFVNGDKVALGPSGGFEKNIVLQPGLNVVEIKANKFLGKEVVLKREVVYSAPAPTPSAPTSPATSSPAPVLSDIPTSSEE